MYKHTPPYQPKKSRRGEITKVGDLFEKYKVTLKAPQGTVVKEVVDVIHDLTGILLQPKYVKYAVATKTISITAPSTLKQEIKLHQTEILLHVKARLGNQNVPNIIF